MLSSGLDWPAAPMREGDDAMRDATSPPGATARSGAGWPRAVMLLLIAEKVVQHIAVTIAFMLDFNGMRSSVALDYRLFLIVGAASAVLFALSGWALIQRKSWATGLIIALALVDIIGEFVAQGELMITLNVSLLVATALLVLAFLARRNAGRAGAR